MTLEEALKRLEWKAKDLKKFSDDGRYMGLRSELSSRTCYELGVEILQEIAAIKEALMSLQDGAQPAVAEQHKQSTPCGEPVAWLWELTGEVTTDPDRADGMWLPLYTTPPQRKPLTDEEIYDMYNEPRSDAEMIAFARAIEAAHGIKE